MKTAVNTIRALCLVFLAGLVIGFVAAALFHGNEDAAAIAWVVGSSAVVGFIWHAREQALAEGDPSEVEPLEEHHLYAAPEGAKVTRLHADGWRD